MKTNEVPKVVVSRLSLRNFIMWLGLYSMNKVRKLDCILNEENGDIVSNNIPISFLCIKLDCEAADITNSVLAPKLSNL